MMGSTRRWFGIGSAALAALGFGPRANGEPMSPAIVVDGQKAAIDAPVTIELKGFPRRRPVTLTATETFPSGSRWQAEATFVSDEDGRIEVARQAPVAGSYDGVAPMGLFWSMARLPGDASLPADWALRPFRVRLEATSAEGVGAATEFERRVAAPGVTRQEIRTTGLVGTLFLPPGDRRFPTVIVVSGGGGAIEEFKAAVLASRGYAGLALAYFAQPGLPRGLVNIPLEYFETAIGWVRAQAWFSDRLLAVWGDSRGGELALLLGVTFPEIGAVMAWEPSGVLFWALGLAEPGDMRPRAAWTFRGKPLPFLQENNPAGDPVPKVEPGRPTAYAPFYRSQLRDAQAVERATIPVEKIRGPVQLVSGSDDQMWPSADLADITVASKRTATRFRSVTSIIRTPGI